MVLKLSDAHSILQEEASASLLKREPNTKCSFIVHWSLSAEAANHKVQNRVFPTNNTLRIWNHIIFHPTACVRDQLKGCHFRSAAEIQIALKDIHNCTLWLPQILQTVQMLVEICNCWKTVLLRYWKVWVFLINRIQDMAPTLERSEVTIYFRNRYRVMLEPLKIIKIIFI